MMKIYKYGSAYVLLGEHRLGDPRGASTLIRLIGNRLVRESQATVEQALSCAEGFASPAAARGAARSLGIVIK